MCYSGPNHVGFFIGRSGPNHAGFFIGRSGTNHVGFFMWCSGPNYADEAMHYFSKENDLVLQHRISYTKRNMAELHNLINLQSFIVNYEIHIL